jgi:N4-gp56 family major capsid protein
MANITPTTAAVMIPEVWSGDILRAVESNLVLANLVKRYDADVKSGGDTVHIPNVANFTAADKTAGSAVTFAANTETENSITINKHKVVPFLVEDIVKAQSRYDLRSEYTDKAGYAISKAIDSDIAALYSGLSQSVDATTALTDAHVITAIEYLDTADAPRDGRSFVIHPKAMADLRALDKFTRYDAIGSKGVQDGGRNGLVANVYGIDVYLSTNVALNTTPTPDEWNNLMFHKEAFGLALQKAPTVESEYSVDYLGTKVAAHTIYGVSELRDTFGVNIKLQV